MIQIASLVTEQGQARPLVRNVMTLNSCAPIVGAEVMAFTHEEDLLKVACPLQGQPSGARTAAAQQVAIPASLDSSPPRCSAGGTW